MLLFTKSDRRGTKGETEGLRVRVESYLGENLEYASGVAFDGDNLWRNIKARLDSK